MTRRRVILVLGACAVACLLGVAFWPGEREPEYLGKTLSEWVKLCDYKDRDPASPHFAEATNAVRQIGTSALPCVVKWVQCDTRGRMAGAILVKLPAGMRSKIAASPRFQAVWGADQLFPRFAAMFCSEALGSVAKPAIPDLARIMNDPKADLTSRQVAIMCLSLIGRDSIPALLLIVKDRARVERVEAIESIGTMRVPADDTGGAVSALVECLNDKNEDVARVAAEALGQLAAEPTVAVPALVECLRDSRRSINVVAAEALGKFGSRAREAVPALLEAVTNADGARRLHFVATNALTRIAPEALKTRTVSDGDGK